MYGVSSDFSFRSLFQRTNKKENSHICLKCFIMTYRSINSILKHCRKSTAIGNGFVACLSQSKTAVTLFSKEFYNLYHTSHTISAKSISNTGFSIQFIIPHRINSPYIKARHAVLGLVFLLVSGAILYTLRPHNSIQTLNHPYSSFRAVNGSIID